MIKLKNEKKLAAYSEMSKAEYAVGIALDDLKQAQKQYKEELMNECIQNILQIQKEDEKLTERDLKIFISDLVTKVSDVKSR